MPTVIMGEVMRHVIQHVIQDMKPFSIAGVERAVTREGGEGLRVIPRLWEAIFENPLFLYIDAHAKTDGLLKNAVVGACRNMSDDNQSFDYLTGREPADDAETGNLTVYEVPPLPGSYSATGGPMPDSVQNAWSWIFAEWLPSSGHAAAEGPQLELYPPMGDEEREKNDMLFEIWIPVG